MTYCKTCGEESDESCYCESCKRAFINTDFTTEADEEDEFGIENIIKP